MSQINALNVACPAFQHNDVGTKLNAIITMINEAKADHNAHTHSGAGVAPTSGHLIATADLAAWNNIMELNVCCVALQRLGDFFADVKTFLDEYKTDHNAHTHTAAAQVPDGVAIASSVPSISPAAIEAINSACPSLGDAVDLGAAFSQLVTLATELKADFNAHVHPTALTNPPTQQIAAASVATLA